MIHTDDTIVAISTPLGMGAIGIVRLSGPEALSIAQTLFKPYSKGSFVSHKALLGRVLRPDQSLLDQGLLLYMQGPKSFTGEDVIEFQCHGSPMLLNTLLTDCISQGARLAERGEFSQRAFLNGKLDLTQTEAIAELIHSRSHQAMNQAVFQLEGHLSAPIRALRTRLLNLLVRIEASIDFPDEVDPVSPHDIEPVVHEALAEAERLLASAFAGKIWRQGVSIAIVGQPNVGKSTLLNRLLRYDRAIVSDIAGTTRDTVEDDYNLKGIPVKIIDTAGLRTTGDAIETIGIERTLNTIEKADAIVLVLDMCQRDASYEENLLQRIAQPLVVVWNKADLRDSGEVTLNTQAPQITLSAQEGQGIDTLEETLFQLLTSGHSLEYKVTVNERHALCLEDARHSLHKVLDTLEQGLPEDFLSIDIKSAIASFGEILGESLREEVIHEIFHQFCVGK